MGQKKTGLGHAEPARGAASRPQLRHETFDASSPDALGEVRNLPAGAAGAAGAAVAALAHARLDLQQDPKHRWIVRREANSHSPAWRLVFGSIGWELHGSAFAWAR